MNNFKKELLFNKLINFIKIFKYIFLNIKFIFVNDIFCITLEDLKKTRKGLVIFQERLFRIEQASLKLLD